jgi:isopenicillin N synthase-like dioxygenase
MSDLPIPIIDISDAVNGGDMGPAAAEIDAACREIGFFQIVGHGLDQPLLDIVYREVQDVWALPRDEKEALRSPRNDPFRGWYTRDDKDGAILQEKWEINRFDSPGDARAHGVPERYADHFHANLWPEQLPDFVAAAKACFTAGRALGDRVMALFAVALGLDETFFDAAIENDSSYFAVNSYPGASRGEPGEVALFEHSDSGTLTLLHQRGNYEGLQVMMRSGERYAVPLIDDAILVNIGDLMARWTNDAWVATKHRVVLGEPGDARTSITTFHTPAIDALISPVPTCVGPEGPRYEPITVYDWEPVFLAKSYA